MASRGPTDVQELIAHAAGLRRLAVRLVGENDADDVLQDAVVAGIDGAPNESHALRHWLVRVVRNLSASRHRVDGHRADRERAVARPESQRSTGELVERMEVQRIVAEEVLQLAEPYRTAVLALHFEGDSAEDYARRIGVPGATVRSWSKRGLDTLRTRLDKRFGGERSAWSACLLSLARPENVLVPTAIVGGLVVKKAVAASIVVVLAAWFTWSLTRAPELAATANPITDSRSILDSPIDSKPAEEASVAPAGFASRRPAGSEIATTATVFGVVTWSPDGTPAAGIGVRLVPSDHDPRDPIPARSILDPMGRFHFDEVAPGEYELHVDRSTAIKAVSVRAGEQHELSLAVPHGLDVVGNVLEIDGTPVPFAEICIREPNTTWSSHITIADDVGSFRVEGVGNLASLFARVPGRAPSGLRQVSSGMRRIDLYLGERSGAVTGRVLDPAGNPCPGANVRVRCGGDNGMDPSGHYVMRGVSIDGVTDESGRFELLDAEPGPSTVNVDAVGYPSTKSAVDVRPGEVSEVVVHLPAVARVYGRMTRSTGAPVEGAQIWIVSLERDATELVGSDSDGRYDTGRAPTGRVRLYAQQSDWIEARLEVELAPGADFDWSPILRERLPIRGRLVDSAGNPLVDKSVSLSVGANRQQKTDAAGHFEFEFMDAREYSVAYTEGDTFASAERVEPSQQEIVLVAERASARIVGRVTDSAGLALADVNLRCERADVRSAADGSFEFERVRSGVRVIELRDSRLSPFVLASVDVKVGAIHDVGALVVPGNGSISVRARSQDGAPIGWTKPVLVRVDQRGAQLRQQGWSAGKDWVVDDLPAGEYEISAQGAGVATQVTPFTIVAGAETQMELELHFGRRVEIEIGVLPGADLLGEVELRALDAADSSTIRGRWDVPRTGAIVRYPVWLLPGDYEIVARAHDGRVGRERVRVLDLGSEPNRVNLVVR